MSQQKSYKTSILFINSGERTSGDVSSFEVVMRNSGVQDVTEYAVESVTVPFTWYPIRTGRDAFQVTSVADGTLTVSVASGQYTATTLATALQAALNAAATTGTWTVAYSSTTLKYTISVAGDTYSYTAADLTATTMSTITGFTAAQAAATASKTATNVVNITGDNRLYVQSTKLSNNDAWDTQAAAFNKSSTIADILIDEDPGGVVHDKKSLAFWRQWPSTKLSKIDFKLLHEDGSVVDLNGANWQITIYLRGNANV